LDNFSDVDSTDYKFDSCTNPGYKVLSDASYVSKIDWERAEQRTYYINQGFLNTNFFEVSNDMGREVLNLEHFWATYDSI